MTETRRYDQPTGRWIIEPRDPVKELQHSIDFHERLAEQHRSNVEGWIAVGDMVTADRNRRDSEFHAEQARIYRDALVKWQTDAAYGRREVAG